MAKGYQMIFKEKQECQPYPFRRYEEWTRKVRHARDLNERMEYARTCQLVSREMPETIKRTPVGLRGRGPLRGGLSEKSEGEFLICSEICIPSLFVYVASRTGLLCKLNHNAAKEVSQPKVQIFMGLVLIAHERFAVKVVQSVFCILSKYWLANLYISIRLPNLWIFEFNKAKT
jgi:hypothetical protein